MQGELTCGQSALQPARVAMPQHNKPLLQQARLFVGNDLPGAVELLDLLFVPRPLAFVADGRVRADHRALRRQLAFEDRHDRRPDVLRLGRAAGQIVIHVDRLVERLQRVVEDRQVQRALGHLRLGLRADVLAD